MAQKKTDWEKLNLRGKVKSTNATEYNMNETEGEDRTVRHQFVFNNKGYKTQEVLREGFDTKCNSTFKYNADNELSEEISKLVHSTSSRKYKYDKKNNTAIENYYVANGVLITKTTLKYDDRGNLLERHIENEKNKEKNKLVENYWFKYDENNNLIEQKQLIGAVSKTVTFKYDENNRVIEQNDYDANGLPTYWYTYKYDEKDNVIEEISAYRGYEKTIINYVYVYDSQGNWIERREQLGTVTQILSRREIQYF
jgi:hypothetical protein